MCSATFRWGTVWRGTEAVLLYPVCLSEAGRAGHLAPRPGDYVIIVDPFEEEEGGVKIGSEQRKSAVSSRSGAADVKILVSSLISGEAVVIRFLATPPVPLGTNPSSIWQHVRGI